MAIHRGIQSALFYYLSCAPCAEAGYRKKRKKEAERGRADREALYVEMPNVYRHPSPSSTNPHWATEIAAGPTLAHRGRKKNANSGKDGDSASRRGLKSSMTQRSNDSAVPSSVSVDLGLGMGADRRNDSKMQFQRYQREDEELWGSTTSLPTERVGSRGSSGVTRPPAAHVRDGESYRKAKTPAVNDLHPAIVTRLASKEEAKWMMQGPPTADVMSGKERASRSRSDSGGSRLSARSGVPLSREVSERIVAQKLKSGEMLPSPTLSRASTALSENASKGQRHDRIATDEIDFAQLNDSPGKAKRRPSPIRIQVSESDSNDSAVTVLRDPAQAPHRPQPKRLASRPQLSTIKSDSLVPSSGEDDAFYTPTSTPKENSLPTSRQSASDKMTASTTRDRISRRTPLLLKDDSLKALHDLAPDSALFRSHVVSSEDLPRLPPPRKVRLPSTDSSEEETLAGSPELGESWGSAEDFALPEWVHAHTKREGVRERWSMDI